jgi:D-alanine-D-alanine ligase
MDKKNIALITGGDSSEIVISHDSAKQLSEMLDHERYNIYIINIQGKDWTGMSDSIKGLPVDKNDFSISTGNGKLFFDCAFISIHGTPGEDGKLQSYFDMIGIPYTTSNACTSALTFNKYMAKNYLRPFDISVAKTILLNDPANADLDEIIRQTGLPCFIKPNKGGSSFGISKVKKKEDLTKAIELAFKEDDEILAEQFLEGRELTCGLVKMDGQEIIFPITEIISKTDFFDFEAKYTKGMSDEITPAKISAELEQECKILSSKIYDLYNCSGIVRMDYIYASKTLFFLEVNTVPGMSKNSIIPQQIRAMGASPTDVFTKVIEHSIQKS